MLAFVRDDLMENNSPLIPVWLIMEKKGEGFLAI